MSGFLIGLIPVTGVTFVFVLGVLLKWWWSRQIHVVLSGLPGAGKTALFNRWVNKNVAESVIKGQSRTVRSNTKRLPRQHIRYGGYIILPRATDTPGSQPGDIVDSFAAAMPPLLMRFLDVAFRRKRVLLVILSPTESLTDTTSDHDYVTRQQGMVESLTTSMLQTRQAMKPDLVIIFLSKLDLVASAKEQEAGAEQLAQLFKDHISRVKVEAGRIPVEVIAGSALKGWRVSHLFDALQAHVVE